MHPMQCLLQFCHRVRPPWVRGCLCNKYLEFEFAPGATCKDIMVCRVCHLRVVCLQTPQNGNIVLDILNIHVPFFFFFFLNNGNPD